MSDENQRSIEWNANIKKFGDETHRYLRLKTLCQRQQRLLKALHGEVECMRSQVEQSLNLKEMWRTMYLELKESTYENLGEFQDTDRGTANTK